MIEKPSDLTLVVAALMTEFVEGGERTSNAGKPPSPHRSLSSLHNDSRGINGEIKAPSAIITERDPSPYSICDEHFEWRLPGREHYATVAIQQEPKI